MYGLAHGSTSLAKRLYAERFPGRHEPDDNEFTAVYRRRSVTKSSRLAGRPTTVLQQIDESLSTSTRVT